MKEISALHIYLFFDLFKFTLFIFTLKLLSKNVDKPFIVCYTVCRYIDKINNRGAAVMISTDWDFGRCGKGRAAEKRADLPRLPLRARR